MYIAHSHVYIAEIMPPWCSVSRILDEGGQYITHLYVSKEWSATFGFKPKDFFIFLNFDCFVNNNCLVIQVFWWAHYVKCYPTCNVMMTWSNGRDPSTLRNGVAYVNDLFAVKFTSGKALLTNNCVFNFSF